MSLTKTLADCIRILSTDAVEKAQSGHPGMPLGMADIATVLWKKFLKHSPKNPHWFNRDRFVLSNGHGSMLLYSLLHLTGYNLTIQDISNFRQLHSKTPGHPECTDTPGVETTTGPLGQGLANAVGFALAEKILAAEYNQSEFPLVNHYTYAFAGDGCLMEGISHEACSLAGTLGLGKLIVFYDDNGISIDGHVERWFMDDTATRFTAYHWHVIGPIDGHDFTAIEQAILSAQAETDKPTLIICKTVIGYGSNVAGSEKAHGAPLGSSAMTELRQALNWPHAPFEIPDSMYATWNHVEQGELVEQQWLQMAHDYQLKWPSKYHGFLRRINGDLPDDWQEHIQALLSKCQSNTQAMATRKASQFCIQHLTRFLPELLGGSADLTGSNNTDWPECKVVTHDMPHGNYIHYGVREFAMAAIMNGIALHGGFIPFGGTFLVFADYARNAIRLSALMQQRVIYILTHDSIGLGEDGPTHQPIEHAAMLRMTPNLRVWRPADLTETAIAWQNALEHHTGPTCLLLSRQSLPVLTQHVDPAKIHRGGYILYDSESTPDVIVIATGSELQLAVSSAQVVKEHGIKVRVVSMVCAEQFLAQNVNYQEQVLPNTIRKRIAIEAAASQYWYRFVGIDGMVLGLERFGLSAPANDIYAALGLTVEKVVEAIHTLLKNSEK